MSLQPETCASPRFTPSFGTVLRSIRTHLELCQRVLAVPFKRARSRPVEYLEFDEIQAVLDRN